MAAMSLRVVAYLASCCLVIGGYEARSQNVSRESDVVYGRKFGLALTLEVLTPPSRNGLGVVWVVSSSGTSSREQTLQESFTRRIAPLLERGFTVFAVIHGSAPLFNVEEQLGDVTRAVRFIRYHAARFGVDGQRLAIAGSSAGGLLALAVAMRGDPGVATADDGVDRESSRVQAAGAFFAPADLLNYGAAGRSVIDMMLERGAVIDPSFQFYDIDPKTRARRTVTERGEMLRRLREVSPVDHVSAGDPPTLLIHGDRDSAVPLQQSRQLHDRLRDASVPVRLVVREGAGHAYQGWEADAALLADWFLAHLRQRVAAPQQ
jgi:acetyl esterase/lipase